jgi:hypothetical protein
LKSALLLLSTLMLVTLQAQTTPNASLSGRVKGPGGGGAVNGSVSGLVAIGTLGYRDGRRFFQPNGSTQADALGNYIFASVGPGEYYVRAESLPNRGIPTYYPGTADIDAATKISVGPGQEIVGIDFDASNPPTFRISGIVRGIPASTAAPGLPNAILGITFASTDSRSPDPSAGPLLQSTRGGASGEFEVSLPAGEWDLFPVVPIRTAGAPTPGASGVPIYATGRARVRLVDRNVENIVITVWSADIKGRIVIPGSPQGEFVPPVPIRVILAPEGNYPSPLVAHLRTSQSVGTAGEFVFAAVPPGRYVFQVLPIPSDHYLADMRVGSKSIYDDGVITVATEPVDPVEIVLRRGGGNVRVTVRAQDSAASVGGSLRRIVVMPVEARRENALLYRTVFPDSFPFVVSALAPGRYQVFAFQELPPGGAEQNAEFMAKYENLGVTIDVVEGQTVNVQVPWIPAAK